MKKTYKKTASHFLRDTVFLYGRLLLAVKIFNRANYAVSDSQGRLINAKRLAKIFIFQRIYHKSQFQQKGGGISHPCDTVVVLISTACLSASGGSNAIQNIFRKCFGLFLMLINLRSKRIAAVKRFSGTVVMEREEKVCPKASGRIHAFFKI